MNDRVKEKVDELEAKLARKRANKLGRGSILFQRGNFDTDAEVERKKNEFPQKLEFVLDKLRPAS